MKLTKTAIDNASYRGDGKSRFVIWDDSCPGFGLRVYPQGEKSFVVSYRLKGRKRMKVIGRYGFKTLDKARAEAKTAIGQALDGRDPFEEKDKGRTGKSVKELVEEFIELYAKQHKKSWQKDEARLKRYVLPVWGSRKTSSITPADCQKLHHEITALNKPYMANRVIEVLRVMFRLAKQWGYYQDDNPAKTVKDNREEKRDRWATQEEVRRILSAAEQDKNIYAGFAIKLYLLTGLRKNELLQAKWEDVDWHQEQLRVPETKAGRPHYLPLSQDAVNILKQMPKQDGNPRILPGLSEGQPLNNITKPWMRIRKAAGVSDLRLHDLRRTCGSWLAQSGASLHLIGKVLNHSNASTTQVYARFKQDNVRQALDQLGSQIMAAVKNEPAEIIKMPANKLIPSQAA